METGKQIRNVRKEDQGYNWPRLGIQTGDTYTFPHAWNAFNYVSMTLRGILGREREV